MTHTDFDFVDDPNGGHFVLVGGPLSQLRPLLAKGDVDSAVRLYEDTGSSAREELLQEATTASFETKRSIAQLFLKARDFGAAALAFQSAQLEGDAAEAFDHAGQFPEAAAAWGRAGEVLKAAAAFERAGQTDEALALYQKAGATDRAAECLARGGRYAEAAKAFAALGNAHAEIEALRSGLGVEPSSLALAARLAELMLQHGRREQAAQLLVDTAGRNPAAKDDARFLQLLAQGLEILGNAEAALNVRGRLATLPEPEPEEVVPVVQGTVTVHEAPPGDDAYGFLKSLPMFADLSLPDMKALYRVCTLHQFAPGQHLIEAGQPGRGLFLIVDGQVEVFGGNDANARMLNTLGVGGYVGEISLVQDGPTSARVTARDNAKALFVSRDAFNAYLYSSPAAALCVFRLFTVNLAERVRALSAAK
jgi:tetratricopeptide (TPR) repeat protein